MNWIILEYERDRQIVVCRNMTRLGIAYYHPVEMREVRPSRNAPRSKSILKDFALIPGTMFLRCGIEMAHKALATQYTEHVICDIFTKPLEVPEMQVLRFRAAIADWNETIRKRWERGQDTKATERHKFVKMTLETLASLKEQKFGDKSLAQ